MGDAGHGALQHEELITVEVDADGIVGHGYSYTIGRGSDAVKALIDHDLVPLLRGRDASDIDVSWDETWKALLYVGRGGLAVFAVAGIDVAVWDVRGAREGQPLYAFLGADPRPVRAYGSGVDLPKSLDGLLAQTRGSLERGFAGVKVKIGRRDAADDEARVDAVLGSSGTTSISWSTPTWRGPPPRRLSEDSAPSSTGCSGTRSRRFPKPWRGHVRLVAELEVPIAVGESLHSLHEFRRYVEAGATQVGQIDAITNGGITAARETLRLANSAQLPTSSHYNDEVSAHLLCPSSDPLDLEKHAFARDRYLGEPRVVDDGSVRPTESPSTGARFRDASLAPHRVA